MCAIRKKLQFDSHRREIIKKARYDTLKNK